MQPPHLIGSSSKPKATKLTPEQLKNAERFLDDLAKSNALAKEIEKLFAGHTLPAIALALVNIEQAIEGQSPGIVHISRKLAYQVTAPQT